ESAIPKLQRRYVYCDSRRLQARGAPAQVVCDRLAQRPTPDIMDQPGFLEDRDEQARRSQPGARIVPPDQSLGAAEQAGVQIALGLVMEHELALVQRLAKLILHGKLRGDALGHLLRVEQIPFAAFLCFLERRLGVAKQSIGVRAVLRKERYPDLDREAKYPTVDPERMLHESR